MFKNFIKNVAFSACLVSTLMSGEGWGMTEIENNTTSDFNNKKRKGNNLIIADTNIPKQIKIEISDANSDDISPLISADESIETILESDSEWIQDNKVLIEQACYDENSFDRLLDELFEHSTSVAHRRELYNAVETSWNDENVFEAMVLDDGTFATYRRDHY